MRNQHFSTALRALSARFGLRPSLSARWLRHLVSISATVLTHAKAEMLTSEGVSLSVLKC
jgi:hypothetical protein